MTSIKPSRKPHPLEAIPLRSEGIREQPAPDGGRLLRLPLKPTGRVRVWLTRLFGREELRVALDERGVRFWNAVDGQRSLREVVHLLSREFEASEKVCTEACIRYCADLVKRGFLHLSIPQPGGRP